MIPTPTIYRQWECSHMCGACDLLEVIMGHDTTLALNPNTMYSRDKQITAQRGPNLVRWTMTWYIWTRVYLRATEIGHGIFWQLPRPFTPPPIYQLHSSLGPRSFHLHHTLCAPPFYWRHAILSHYNLFLPETRLNKFDVKMLWHVMLSDY